MNSQSNSGKSRAAILAAFNRLVLSAKGREIRVADIVRQADIGRSTFYEHFSNVQTVFSQSVRGPFRSFAESSVLRNLEQLSSLLQHFADNRQQGLLMMDDVSLRDQMVQVLAEQYELVLASELERQPLLRLGAFQLAESNLGLIRQWLIGKLDCTVSTLAEFILSCTSQTVVVLQQARSADISLTSSKH